MFNENFTRAKDGEHITLPFGSPEEAKAMLWRYNQHRMLVRRKDQIFGSEYDGVIVRITPEDKSKLELFNIFPKCGTSPQQAKDNIPLYFEQQFEFLGENRRYKAKRFLAQMHKLTNMGTFYSVTLSKEDRVIVLVKQGDKDA